MKKICLSFALFALLKVYVLKAMKKPSDAKWTWLKVIGSRAYGFFHRWSVASNIIYIAKTGKLIIVNHYGLSQLILWTIEKKNMP